LARPVYGFGNYVKVNKTDWGWSPWSIPVHVILLRFYIFNDFSKSKKRNFLPFLLCFTRFLERVR